jgi:hypothetical protein
MHVFIHCHSTSQTIFSHSPCIDHNIILHVFYPLFIKPFVLVFQTMVHCFLHVVVSLAPHLLAHLLPVLKQHLGSSIFKRDNLCGHSNEMMVERKGHRFLWTGNREKIIKWCRVSNLQRTSLWGTQRPCITHIRFNESLQRYEPCKLTFWLSFVLLFTTNLIQLQKIMQNNPDNNFFRPWRASSENVYNTISQMVPTTYLRKSTKLTYKII